MISKLSPRNKQQSVSERLIVKGIVFEEEDCLSIQKRSLGVWGAESSSVVLKYRLLGLCV